MPAPDLPPPPPVLSVDRPVGVVLHPRLAEPERFAGSITVMIDNLRASATIAAALSAGAARVFPCLTVDEVRAKAAALEAGGVARDQIVLGGERGGALIEGFDLDNSPAKYTPQRVRGKSVVFTTTNGTAALLHAARAAEVLVGSIANASAIAEAIAADPRPVWLLCAGTRDEVTLDDCLAAGVIAEALIARGRGLAADDSVRLCLGAYREAMARPDGLHQAMRDTRGGRNLLRLEMDADVRHCSMPDVSPVVPRFDAAAGSITLH